RRAAGRAGTRPGRPSRAGGRDGRRGACPVRPRGAGLDPRHRGGTRAIPRRIPGSRGGRADAGPIPTHPGSRAMIVNHITLAVSDVQAARGFLMRYFGLDPRGLPGNDRIAFLRDELGMVLTLTNIDGATEVRYPGAFHIGFAQESSDKVDEIH